METYCNKLQTCFEYRFANTAKTKGKIQAKKYQNRFNNKARTSFFRKRK